MSDNSLKQEFNLAITHLQNNQNISAYNMFLRLAENLKKSDNAKAALVYLLAAECKKRQEKDNRGEVLEAGKQFMTITSNQKNYNTKNAYLCAAKCFMKVGKYDEAQDAFKKSKSVVPEKLEQQRPILIVEDSEAIVLRIKNFLEKLGYNDIHVSNNGKDAIQTSERLLKEKRVPIVLLDMGLPDIGGDEVADKMMKLKLDIPIILITADEKSSSRVHKTISYGATAFIQKPFNLDDLKKSLEKVEIEEIILKK